MLRITAALLSLSAAVAPALAHPGHVLDQGAGHDHIAATVILAGIGVGTLCYLAARFARLRRRPA